MKKQTTYRDEVLSYVAEKYRTSPEYPWQKWPEHAVLRHTGNKKWYAVIMKVSRRCLGLKGDDVADIINLKCEPGMIDFLRGEKGILPAYHMNKDNWISILLDGSMVKEQIFSLIDMSFELTDLSAAKKSGKAAGHNTNWLVPANPKYYDIETKLSKNPEKTFTWKQSNNILAGDIVYLYLAAPVCAVLYKCKVVEADIPYHYSDDNITIKRVMKLKLLKQYAKKQFNRDVLLKYGIYSVRGPRSIPYGLLCSLEAAS